MLQNGTPTRPLLFFFLSNLTLILFKSLHESVNCFMLEIVFFVNVFNMLNGSIYFTLLHTTHSTFILYCNA